MSSVECHFIGPLELTIDGDAPPPELLWRKNVALLAYLACSTNRRRTRDQLVGLLWPDKTDSAARQSLREAIRVVRRHLGAASLKTEGDSV